MFTFVNMKARIRISESEWKVMEVIWAEPPTMARDVIDALAEAENWTPQTIKTLIGRLVKKGALSFEKEGNRYLYHPEIDRDAAVAAETGSFLDRVSRGSLAPMLAHLVDNRSSLDQDEIDILRQLLRKETKSTAIKKKGGES